MVSAPAMPALTTRVYEHDANNSYAHSTLAPANLFAPRIRAWENDDDDLEGLFAAKFERTFAELAPDTAQDGVDGINAFSATVGIQHPLPIVYADDDSTTRTPQPWLAPVICEIERQYREERPQRGDAQDPCPRRVSRRRRDATHRRDPTPGRLARAAAEGAHLAGDISRAVPVGVAGSCLQVAGRGDGELAEDEGQGRDRFVHITPTS